MSLDLPDRLRLYAQQFEDQHAPPIMVIALREAAKELDRLRAGGCARDQGTTQYCAEAAILAAKVGKLEAECFSLASWQCVYHDGKTGLVCDEHGNQYCAKDKEAARLAKEVERLKGVQQKVYLALLAEREKVTQLTAALEVFACDCAVHERCTVPDNCRNFQARRTLERHT